MLIDNRKALDNADITIQIPIIDHCRRCGVPISNTKMKKVNLWCNHCRKYVDAELNGGEPHPLDFYFKYYQGGKIKSNAKDAESE